MVRRLPRRDKLKIYGDLLSILHEEARTQKVVLTRIQLRTNVPYDRLKIYLKDLRDLGLITEEPTLELTEKGKQYIKEYQTVLDFMKRMGLTYH